MASARDNIPSPRGLPVIGNLLDVQDEVPIHASERLIDIYGPIVKLNLLGQERILAASAELVEELCDERRFWKTPGDGAGSLNGARSGLFTAPSEDNIDWQQAHRILMPAFGPLSIQAMFSEMHDIASQLVLKWARQGPSYRIPVTLDFTRLTLDTIALCAMDFRFNSFYMNEMHPFVDAMNTSLSASSDRLKIGSLMRKMLPFDKSIEAVQQSRRYMGQVAAELVKYRRDNPTEKHDLLNAMINGKDPKTGEKMEDSLITANMVTFLIAGHETTSGLLSFAMLNLLKNPAAYFKAQQEVDNVLGCGKMTIDHLKDLQYINAVLRETLRLAPTAPGFSRSIRRDNLNDTEPLLGGKYAINRNDKVTCLLSKAQRDPKVFGDDANEFKPERMLEDAFQRLPKGAWKPFGTGVRACIGRAFAWQEAQMVLALLLQNFNFKLDDPSYEMKIKQTLTIKPEGFYMRATLREGITATTLQHLLSTSDNGTESIIEQEAHRADSGVSNGKPMTITYGSNTGTCQALAQKLNVEARRRGFAPEVKEMNAAVSTLPKDHPLLIITASYEGQPPDNADQFVTWLETRNASVDLDGIEYAVFGCGHRDWKDTFQRIPSLVDDLLEQHGGKRIVERGLSDSAENNTFQDFENWMDNVLWAALAPEAGHVASASSLFEAEISTQNRSSYLRQDVSTATVIDNKLLTAVGEPEKRHIQLKLPEEQTYQTGDYLAVLPLNPQESVSKVRKHFGIPEHASVTIKPSAATFLPTGVALSVMDLLRGYVELAQPASKKDVQACVEAAKDTVEKEMLRIFADDEGFAEVAEQRMSLIDILCRYPSVDISFSTFLSMLPPLRLRHYSISSSPLRDPTECSLTFAVLNRPAMSGVGHFVGVASNYLAMLEPGDEILAAVRSTNQFFHLPADIESTPILMFGAGTGLAPFRGFVEERSIQIAAGRKLAPATLFLGCRSSTKDRLYGDEMDAWAKSGAVDIRYAFSEDPGTSNGCKYVQDRILQDKQDVIRMWQDGAKVFVCGGPEVSSGIANVAKLILLERRKELGEDMTEQQAAEWFRDRRNERYVVDVFA